MMGLSHVTHHLWLRDPYPETGQVFCFFSFFFAIDETEARLTVSTTMFLATSALLYVIGTEVHGYSGIECILRTPRRASQAIHHTRHHTSARL